MDPSKRILIDDSDHPLQLTPKVFDTLLHLVARHGEVVSKDELMNAIWPDTIVEENNLNKNISILRRVLTDNARPHRLLVTVPGKGYKFVADVAELDEPRTAARETAAMDAAPFSPRSFSTKWLTTVLVAVAAVTAMLLFSSYRKPGDPTVTKVQTIAVLPFRPLLAENRDEALELGMADSLISRLSLDRKVLVRPLSSVRSLGGLDQDAAQAGRQLRADSVVDGSIQRWGDKIRVSVRLTRAADGALLWSDAFDEKFTDIFKVQDLISSRVAGALSLQLASDGTKFERRETKDPKAYALYLRGRFNVFKITEPDIRGGIALYEQAIAADPNYALAYAAMADAYRTLASASFAPSKEVFPQAKSLALRALELDDSLAEPHIVLGWIAFLYDWDWKAAEQELKRAIELSPNESETHRAYAHLLSNLGRHEEAISEGRLARELAPLTLITAALETQYLFYGGRYAEAIEKANQTLELNSDFWVAHNALGRIYFLQERFAESLAELRRANELSGNGVETLTQLGYVLSKTGEPDQARHALNELHRTAATRFVPEYDFALILNGLNETDKALDHLERSLDSRESQLTFLKIDSRWDNLRSERRFIDVFEKLNFRP